MRPGAPAFDSCRTSKGAHSKSRPLAPPRAPLPDQRTSRREQWLAVATGFDAAVAPALASTVLAAVQRAKHGQASLRLTDLDLGDGAWTFAGGLPTYLTFTPGYLRDASIRLHGQVASRRDARLARGARRGQTVRPLVLAHAGVAGSLPPGSLAGRRCLTDLHNSAAGPRRHVAPPERDAAPAGTPRRCTAARGVAGVGSVRRP